MPFTCTLPSSEHEISGETIVIPIGYDDTSSYTIVLGFTELENPAHREFYFQLTRFDNEGRKGAALLSGQDTKAFIPDAEHRALILQAVCERIPILLEQHRPEWILRITSDGGPPEKALKKHAAIAEAFKTCGYEENPVQDRLGGCKAWWMWNSAE